MTIARFSKQTNWIRQVAKPVGLFALVLCLLLSQALGFMHGIEHEQHSDQRNHHHEHKYDHQNDHQNEHQKGKQLAATTSAGSASWIADLFAGHSEESTCQVFDQLSHGGALLGKAVEIAQPTVASFFLDTYQGATPAYRRSLVQARGPPAASTLV